MNKTSIEWTDLTWNPLRARLKTRPLDCNCSCSKCAASNSSNSKTFDPESHTRHKPPCMVRTGTFCTRISPGCANCYASVINKRFGNGLEYTVPNLEKVEFYVDEKILAEPLHRKKPARIFVGDMFDLFHEAIPDGLIDQVFAVAMLAEQHTFQFLTKRAERMQRYLYTLDQSDNLGQRITPLAVAYSKDKNALVDQDWPAPHLHFGVSIEDQKRAYERVPFILQAPAAVRFLSVEPMLEAIDLTAIRRTHAEGFMRPLDGRFRTIDWVICGGESGPGARPFNLAWAESLLEQCRAAGVPFFMKQIGSDPRGAWAQKLGARDRKGGDPSEWPEALRVREFPASQKAEVVPA